MDDKTKNERESTKAPTPAEKTPEAATEVGGRDGPEPTRYGDWEVNGICVDF